MQSVSSGIWTRVAVSISYDDKHYTTGTSLKVFNLSANCYIAILEPLNPVQTNNSNTETV